ncbi:MAG: HAD family hydrolase [Sphingomonadaceae bacterium]|nr:HAD family hydrolase [Sphingomonadaceae bacterium]
MTATVLPHELPQLLDAWPCAKVLSLDCFDTLIWRDCHAPADIFACLPGISPAQRARAEQQARKAERLERGRNEVHIDAIYRALFPNGSDEQVQLAIEAELAEEARHCYAFTPTVELMREAKVRGMQVVIVSDTYLDEAQLSELIAASAGEDVAAMIDCIFCSSTYGKSKGEGLYEDVLAKLRVAPQQVVHLGDNRAADVGGVAPFGVNAVHLVQFPQAVREQIRLESAVSSMVEGPAQDRLGAPQPHRAGLALAMPQLHDPAEQLGAATLGPVFAGFERWLQAEARALEEKHGGTVHWLFLMRDGHLPQLVHQATPQGAANPGHAVELSRFTATAASLSDEKAVLAYAKAELGVRPQTLARQLLMEEGEINTLLGDLSPEEGNAALWKALREIPRRRRIARASRAYAERLVAHVRRTVDPQRGDVLMLVDLGYNGSVQNRVDALLARELGVHVAGRYLLLREMDSPGLDKKGFVDARHYDAHALEALCANVAVLEQACTSDCGSVVDYEQDGSPIRRANEIDPQQSAQREKMQRGALRFVREQASATIRVADPCPLDLWRRGAAAAMARLMFLPQMHELAVIDRFQHDVNMGTAKTVALFDPAIARRGLRERGLFYMRGSERMYLPAELAGQGAATRLALLATKRFGLPLTFADFSEATLAIPAVFATTQDAKSQIVTAHATQDGWYMAAIPIGESRYAVALQFGAACDYLQLDSAFFEDQADFLGRRGHGANSSRIDATAEFDSLPEIAPGLYDCSAQAGFMIVHPPASAEVGGKILTVVFRPVFTTKVNRVSASEAHRTAEELCL